MEYFLSGPGVAPLLSAALINSLAKVRVGDMKRMKAINSFTSTILVCFLHPDKKIGFLTPEGGTKIIDRDMEVL